MEDPLKPFVPEFGGVEIENGVEFLQLSNLLSRFDTPNIMDCKVGCRLAPVCICQGMLTRAERISSRRSTT